MILRDAPHYVWDNALRPQAVIDSGEVVVFDTVNIASERFAPEVTSADMPEILSRVTRRAHRLTGPVYVRGAKPGDALEIEVIDLRTGPVGYTAFFPGRGLLPEDFPTPAVKVWTLGGERAVFAPGISVPIEPFLGVMGVAPSARGAHSNIPPGAHGGNLDIKQLTVGARLLLPVLVEGALFSCGDGHAAQGDGEVCVNAIETDMVATLRLTVREGRSVPEAQFSTRGPLLARTNTAGWYATTGHGTDLMAATRAAVRHMIDHLAKTYGMGREDAYILCSVAVDLKISEVVNAPHWVVSAFLPLCLFER